MKDNQEFWFVTFADRRYISGKRLSKEAELMGGIFDHIDALDENDFDSWYIEKNKVKFNDPGFGYWTWKPYIIRRTLDKMKEGDILLYCDGGCTLNCNGIKRFREYIEMINNSNNGILTFEQGLLAKDYTKADLFSYLGVLEDISFTHTNQANAGSILLKKCKNAAQCVDEWFYVTDNHYDLIDDSPSKIPNFSGFAGHRHDQSVWDILSRKYGAIRISDKECYSINEDWDKLIEYPIWFTRYKERHKSFLEKLKAMLQKVI